MVSAFGVLVQKTFSNIKVKKESLHLFTYINFTFMSLVHITGQFSQYHVLNILFPFI